MKVLMLVNWKVEYSKKVLLNKQPPDYYIKGKPYWFYRYFEKNIEVDVIDIRSFKWLENFEKEKLRFYIIQSLRAIPKLHKYDLIVSHGMQSGVVLSLWRRFFKSKSKHIVFDIGSFNSASESGIALKMMQFASKSIDGIIYHTSNQIKYYKEFFPWIVDKSKFIPFGTDPEFFNTNTLRNDISKDDYIICVGYSKRDWNTLVEAYKKLNTSIKLRLVGHVEESFSEIPGIEQIPFIPINELINQIKNAKFCVLPLESFNYSYGQMTLMQQMSLGKCVIAAKVPSLEDYVEDKKTALLYNPKDIDDLKQKMQFLIENPKVIERISENAHYYINHERNESTMAKLIEEYFNQF